VPDLPSWTYEPKGRYAIEYRYPIAVKYLAERLTP